MRIFAGVARCFISEKEVFATDVLSAILQSDPEVRRVVLNFCRDIAGSIPADLDFLSQVSDDNGRPDIVGSANGRRALVIEGKFDAPLTDMQPLGYIDSLPEGGLLLFLVSERRADFVWRELCRKFEIEAAAGVAKRAVVAGRHIALTTWHSLLEHTLSELLARPVAEDIRQLLEFTRGCDMAAFVPFSSEEICNSRLPVILLQTMHVAESALRVAAEKEVCKLRRRPSSPRATVGT